MHGLFLRYHWKIAEKHSLNIYIVASSFLSYKYVIIHIINEDRWEFAFSITDLRAFLRSYKRCGAVLIPFAMFPVKLIFTISMYSGGRNIIALWHSYQLSKTKSGVEMEQYYNVNICARCSVGNTQKMVESTIYGKFVLKGEWETSLKLQ